MRHVYCDLKRPSSFFSCDCGVFSPAVTQIDSLKLCKKEREISTGEINQRRLKTSRSSAQIDGCLFQMKDSQSFNRLNDKVCKHPEMLQVSRTKHIKFNALYFIYLIRSLTLIKDRDAYIGNTFKHIQ